MATERTFLRDDQECPDVRECMTRLATLEANDVHVIAQVRDIKSTVGHIDRAIRGNDKPGLAQRTTSLEDSRDDFEDAQKSTRRWLRGIFAAGVIAGIGAAIRWFTAK